MTALRKLAQRPNPDAPIADWPFRQTIKRPDDIVISSIGWRDFSRCRRDRYCRGYCCRPKISGGR